MSATAHVVSVLPAPCAGVFVTHSRGDRRFGRHWHDCYSFGMVVEGAQSWTGRRGRADAYAGDVINTNPGEVHDGRPLGAPSRRWSIISVDPAVMTRTVKSAGPEPEITQPVIQDRELSGAIRALFASVDEYVSQRASPIAALAFEEALVESCTLLMTRHGSSPARVTVASADLRLVREMLADTPLQPPSLADMAAVTGMSRFKVLRRFEQQYGLPPHRWLLCLRAERARAAIRGGASLASAAADAGFSDQSHMTRVFRELYGYTPGVWLRATRVTPIVTRRPHP